MSGFPWSISQSATWACPLQWWMRYRAQIPPAQPDAVNRVRGRAEHFGLETAYHAAAADTAWRPGTLMNRHREAALTAVEDRWRQEDPEAPDYLVYRAVEDVAGVLDTLPAPPARTVIAVEHRFRLPWEVNGFAVDFTGVLDLALHLSPTHVHVRDWKHDTVGDPASSPQMALCAQAVKSGALATRLLDPVAGDDLTVTVGLYSVRGRREEIATSDDEHRAESLHGLAHDAAQAYDACADVREGRRVIDAFPARPDAERCGGCPFRSYCPQTSAGTWPVRPDVDVDAVRRSVSARLREVGSTR